MSGKAPKPTATSRSGFRGGKDGRRYTGQHGTYTTKSRGGVTLPNEDVGWTITREQYDREERS